jgi:TBC domain-containing protein kinase-like protein
MHPVPLEDLQAQKCPFISAEDLIQLGELLGSSPSKSPTKRSQSRKPLLIVIDIRHKEEYPYASNIFCALLDII